MHHDPISTFQLAKQRHQDDLRNAEQRRSVRSTHPRPAPRHHRTWFAKLAGRSAASPPVPNPCPS
jgi:hypothetical protein